jgi:hypothetical protein
MNYYRVKEFFDDSERELNEIIKINTKTNISDILYNKKPINIYKDMFSMYLAMERIYNDANSLNNYRGIYVLSKILNTDNTTKDIKEEDLIRFVNSINFRCPLYLNIMFVLLRF